MTKRIIKEDSPVNELLNNFNGTLEEPKEEPKSLEAKKEDKPQGYKLNPLYIETKTKRLQIVLKPTVATEMQKTCKRLGTSVNDYIGKLIEKDLNSIAEERPKLISENYKQARKAEKGEL